MQKKHLKTQPIPPFRENRFHLTLMRYRRIIDSALVRHVDSIERLPHEARTALVYSVSIGGKRLRPTIALLACQAVGGSLEDGLDVAIAMELLHTATLVYDDIIDNDEVRRGQPAVHAKFGIDVAIIIAGLLTSRAFHLLIHNRRLVQHAVEALDELGYGAILELRVGCSDMEGYLAMAHGKTGTMFKLASELGALAGHGTAAHRSALREYAANLGIAFQLRDDVLDAIGDENVLGKPIGSDARNERPSIIAVLSGESTEISNGTSMPISEAAENAMDLCRSFARRAEIALARLPRSTPRKNLGSILHYVVARNR
jgi:geranylgeranyl diphosphate synthase type I